MSKSPDNVSNTHLLEQLVRDYGDAPVALAIPHAQMPAQLDLAYTALLIAASMQSKMTADERTAIRQAGLAFERLRQLHDQVRKAMSHSPSSPSPHEAPSA
jgi:hypothetical protein